MSKLFLASVAALLASASVASADRGRSRYDRGHDRGYDRGQRYDHGYRSHRGGGLSFSFGYSRGNWGHDGAYVGVSYSSGRGYSSGRYYAGSSYCPPVYVAPAPVYVAPAPAYCPPPTVYYGYSGYRYAPVYRAPSQGYYCR